MKVIDLFCTVVVWFWNTLLDVVMRADSIIAFTMDIAPLIMLRKRKRKKSDGGVDYLIPVTGSVHSTR